MMQRYEISETYTTPHNGRRRGLRRHRAENPLGPINIDTLSLTIYL